MNRHKFPTDFLLFLLLLPIVPLIVAFTSPRMK